MNTFLSTGNNHSQLKGSILRFCGYCNSIHLNEVEIENLPPANAVDLLFIFSGHENIEEIYRVIYKLRISPNKLRFIGYSAKYDINLLDFKKLKVQFEACFTSNTIKKRTEVAWFYKKLHLFFSGHGEQSLLSCLTWINYYFANYSNLTKSGDYNAKDLYRHFLVPGLKNWKEFTRRFKKYAPILWVAGFQFEMESIEKNIHVLDIKIAKVGNPDSFFNFGEDFFQRLAEITEKIESMAGQTKQAYGKTKPIDC
jgi:hypothetical protein